MNIESKRIMKHYLLILCCICSLTINAQEYYTHIYEDSANAASNLNPYPNAALDTAAVPDGYEPFYINHYGRHGSRYLTSDVKFDMVMKVMDDAAANGYLTPLGKDFRNELRAVYDEQQGLEGVLTRRGAKEHREIAERMARNYPSVFAADNSLKKVNCVSSNVHRCLLSMNNFTLALSKYAPDVQIEMLTGERYMTYINKHIDSRVNRIRADVKEDSLRRSLMDPKVMFGCLFTDPSRMLDIVDDPHDFCRHLYLASCNGSLTDVAVNLLRHYPTDELCREWYIRNERFYMAYSLSKDNEKILEQVARPLLADFVEKADIALGDHRIAADLRFGHDTGLLPFVAFIGLEGQPARIEFGAVSNLWNSSEKICMGSNLQMIFYRNEKQHILVKLRFNETDSCLTDLTPDTGVYYDWNRLRSYLLSL